jgi:hypothetical protein
MIYAYSIREGRQLPGPTSLDKTAVIKHLYTLGRDTSHPSFAVEETLADLEAKTAPILLQIEKARSLPDDTADRELLQIFIATLLMRTRHGQQIIHGYREEVRLRNASRPIDEVPLAEKSLINFDTERMRELFARMTIRTAQPIGDILGRMHWRLLEAEAGHFITSENPVVVYNELEQQWGIGTPGTFIQLPISPSLLLWLGAPESLPPLNPFPLPLPAVNAINGLIIHGARDFLFSHADFSALTPILAERGSGTAPEFGPHKSRSRPPEA